MVVEHMVVVDNMTVVESSIAPLGPDTLVVDTSPFLLICWNVNKQPGIYSSSVNAFFKQ